MEGPGEGEVFLGKRCCLLSVLHSGYCKQTLGERWGRALPTICKLGVGGRRQLLAGECVAAWKEGARV